MRKNLLFSIPIIIVAVLLFMLRITGMKAHIIVSVVGIILLVAHMIATKKEWKCPVVEIIERVFYAIAFITGVVLMNVHGINAVSVIHKISAVLFTVLLFINVICKLTKKSK